MPYFSRSGGSEYLVDCNIDTQAARAARKAVSSGDFDAGEQFVREAVGVNERCYAIESLADWAGDPAWLREWEQRGGTIARAVTAIHRVKWAWEARGGGYAPTVSDGAVTEFGQRLSLARQSLVTALEKDRKEASVVPWMLWYARGSMEPGLADQAYAEGLRRAADLRALHSSRLLSLAPKWGGEVDAMFEFARRLAGSAPRASGAAVLTVQAHDFVFEQLPPMSEHGKTYWLRPEVRSEVVEADTACRDAGLSEMNAVCVRNWLAYGLWRCGELALAKAHFEAIQAFPNSHPWLRYRRGFNWLFGPWRKARGQSLGAQ